MSTTLSITSIGQAAGILQTPVNRIRAAAEALGIRPKLRIDDVDHYSDSDLRQIAIWLANHDDDPTLGMSIEDLFGPLATE